jgi:small-conductance mechanosensitive channel
MRGDFDSETEAQTANGSAPDDLLKIERRMFRLMFVVIAVAVLVSLFFFAWRVTVGLMIGGALAVLNYSWLRASIRAIFGGAGGKNAKPKTGAARYVLRYFIIACIIASIYSFNLASLVAMLAGLSAFAWAGLIEGFIQTYFAIINREGT